MARSAVLRLGIAGAVLAACLAAAWTLTPQAEVAGIAEGSDAVGPGSSAFPRTSTLAGGVCSPPAATAMAVAPVAVAGDGEGGFYVADDLQSFVCHVDAEGAVSVVAGNGRSGYQVDGIDGSDAELYAPTGLAVAPSGDLYIADRWNHRVRMVDADTGAISTVAGTGVPGFAGDGGPATDAQLRFPSAVAVADDGDLLIADSKNNRIRRADAATGVITTVAGTGRQGFAGDGGPAVEARLENPLAVVARGDEIVVADTGNHRVRTIGADGVIRTVAGTGAAAYAGDGRSADRASLNAPAGLAVTPDGLAIADAGNHLVRFVDASGTITTLAGIGVAGAVGDDGPAGAAALSSPRGLAYDAELGILVSDSGNARVRAIGPLGTIRTVAGNGYLAYAGDGGPAAAAHLHEPIGVAVLADGSVVFTDSLNHVVRRVLPDGTIRLFAGVPQVAGYAGDGGPATSATFVFPTGVAAGPEGEVYVADRGNDVVRRIDDDGTITTVATDAALSSPSAVAVTETGVLYIADSGNHRVLAVDGGRTRTVAGTGTPGDDGDGGQAAAAALNDPLGVAVDDGRLLIADSGNHRVRVVDLDTGVITPFAGTGTRGSSANGLPATRSLLNRPAGLAVAPGGDVYIADYGNCVVRRVRSDGSMAAIAGAPPVRGTDKQCGFGDDGEPPYGVSLMHNPTSVAVRPDGSLVVADSLTHRIRLVTGL